MSLDSGIADPVHPDGGAISKAPAPSEPGSSSSAPRPYWRATVAEGDSPGSRPRMWVARLRAHDFPRALLREDTLWIDPEDPSVVILARAVRASDLSAILDAARYRRLVLEAAVSAPSSSLPEAGTRHDADGAAQQEAPPGKGSPLRAGAAAATSLRQRAGPRAYDATSRRSGGCGSIFLVRADDRARALRRGDLLYRDPADPSRGVLARMIPLDALPPELRIVLTRASFPEEVAPPPPAPSSAPEPPPWRSPRLRLLP